MKKRKQRIGFIPKILLILLFILSFITIMSVFYLNILSNIYLLMISILVLVFDIIPTIFILRGKRKRGVILTFILIVIFALVDYYLIKTTDFLSNLNLNYKTYNYSVVVLKKSDYQKLKDISNKNLGYFADDSAEGEKAKSKIQKKIEVEVNSYDDTYKLANGLLEEDVDAILIEDSYLDILDENLSDEEGTFKEKIRKIYSFTIVSKTSDVSKDLNVTKEAFNIYISGIDTYGEISSVSRSDVNMIVTVNPKTKQILLTSIPRDYYVKLHGKSGYKDKLTHAGLYGIDTSIQTLEDLLNIEINYYVKVNFTSVIDIVNAIGGVKVYSEYSFTSMDNYHYTKGYNEVSGEEALSFARERKAFATGDRQRIKNQQALLKALFEKCTSKAIITKYSKLLDSLSGSFVTNMKMSRLTSLIKMQLSNNYTWNIVTNSLNGSDASNYTYSAPSQKAYVMEPEESSVEYATKLIEEVLNGEILDSEKVDADASQANKVTKSNSSESSSTNSSTNSSSSTNTKEGLKVKLVKEVVQFEEGDEYVYYPYIATYDGKDISSSDEITENFSVNGESYDNYYDLVAYVSSLSKGTYQVIFSVRYKGEVATLIQKVVIEESKDKEDTSIDDEASDKKEDDTSSDEIIGTDEESSGDGYPLE